jgi:hypothetical protein
MLVIATAQLMLVLDDTIANIALPTIQRELDVSAAALPWVVSAYVLAFGGLVEQSLAGVASALLSTAQQIGAALGLALLTAIALTASDRRLPGAAGLLPQALANGDTALIHQASQALSHGYSTALAAEAALVLLAAGVVALTLHAHPAHGTPNPAAA